MNERASTITSRSATWRTLKERVHNSAGELELIRFRVGAEVFALPLESMREAVDGAESQQLPDMPSHVTGIISIAGRSIPLCDERPFLGVATTAARPSVLIVKGDVTDSGLAVDELVGSCVIQHTDIRRVPALEDAEGIFVGVFFLDGQLVALLDPAVFARYGEGIGEQREGSAGAVPGDGRKPAPEAGASATTKSRNNAT